MNLIQTSQFFNLYQSLVDHIIWQRQFYRGLSEIEDDAISRLRGEFIVLQTTVEDYLNDENFKPEGIISLLQTEINHIIKTLVQQMSEQTTQLIDEIEQSTELHLQANAIDEVIWQQNQIKWQKMRETNVQKLDSSWRVARETVYNATTGSMAGTLIGGVIGSVFIGIGTVSGAILGAQLGSVFGATSGAYNAVSTIQQQKEQAMKRELNKKIQQFINLNERECTNNIRDMVRQLRQNLDAKLTDQIEQQRALFERSYTLFSPNLLDNEAD